MSTPEEDVIPQVSNYFSPVILESPFAGKTPEIFDAHRQYLDRALADCLIRNEAPFASHAIYPRVLDDNRPAQRAAGIAAGHSWMKLASRVVVYTDYGVSSGMKSSIKLAERLGMPIERRSIGLNPQGDPLRWLTI